MQAVILAAGVSRRLRPLTDNTPKCLLNIGEKNLLHRTIENVTDNGITDFVFVTGYLENMIRDYVDKNFRGIKKTFITNPGYEVNNNSYSLWMTKDFVNDNILLLDSDILFDKKIIAKLTESRHENCLAVNFTKELDEEQIKVIINNENKVLKIGKEISIAASAGESIGIEKFSPYYMKELFSILDRKITKENIINEFYEASFQEIIDSGDSGNSIYAEDVSMFGCMEIDTVSDYEKAQNILI
ncbi:MAG TPA: phosphocholine cytidylyltransferase family protein [Ignavibacteria bacterium]|nr:nucleotidyl transferase [Bacteroidota bacterium]HRI85226.1 phosphocholine cytidylyltransferase family protein [Ignavibacteria bacterium]HRK00336.1 phosphocholine cytidylyltransferase family protein [Ignavibacteria bacterium]